MAAPRASDQRGQRHRQESLTRYIHSQLAGRDDLVAKTVPDYPAFGKRMLLDNGWYAALRKPSVELVDEEVTAVDAEGVICPSGLRRDVDVIVLATGFQDHALLGTRGSHRARRTRAACGLG